LRQALLVAEQDAVGRLNLSTTIELERIVPLSVAALLRGVSVDTIARHFKGHIILTGSKMRGIRIKHVLELGENTSQLPSPRRKRTPLVAPRKRRFGQGSTKGKVPTPSAFDIDPPKAREAAATAETAVLAEQTLMKRGRPKGRPPPKIAQLQLPSPVAAGRKGRAHDI